MSKKTIATLDLSSVLKFNQRYMVQDVSHFPKARKYMVGQYAVVKQIVGSTAHVLFTGNVVEIPVRALIKVPGYKAKSVNLKNADAFAIIRSNPFGFDVGTVIINHDKHLSSEDTIVIHYNGKTFQIPSDIVCSLIESKKTEKPIKAKKIASQTGLSPVMVEALNELVAPHEHRLRLDYIPEQLMRLLPDVNLLELRDSINNEEEPGTVYYDYEGNDHPTPAEADIANTLIHHKRLEAKITKRVMGRIEGMWEKGRNAKK